MIDQIRKDLISAIRTIPIADLKPHPKNYRKHPDDQIAHIIESLRAHGFYRPVIIANDLTILAGHGLVEAAAKMGIAKVPTVMVDVSPDDPLALKILIGDNEIAKAAEIDDRLLTEMLKEINVPEVGLLGTGYNDMQLAALIYTTRAENEIQSFDAAAAWVGMPDFDPGSTTIGLVIKFRNAEDRQAFLQKNGINGYREYGKNNMMSTWWPPEEYEQEDLESVAWKESDEDRG